MGNKNTHVANVPGPDQTNKRVRTSGDVNDVNEEEDYRLMLEELANEKLSLFACEENNVLCEQVKEKKKSKKLKGGTKRKSSSRDGDCKKKKVKKVVGREIASKEATTQLKEFINEIMGSDMKLVIQKTLFQNEEIRFLDRKADDAEIKVRLVGPNLQMFKKPMLLKIWNMSNNKNYVLKTNWCDFVEANKKVLKEKGNYSSLIV
ncbi:B3 domain-containing protein, DNA-binding pseudobarrel domain protein [Tanacetum coccineum]